MGKVACCSTCTEDHEAPPGAQCVRVITNLLGTANALKEEMKSMKKDKLNHLLQIRKMNKTLHKALLQLHNIISYRYNKHFVLYISCIYFVMDNNKIICKLSKVKHLK